MVYSQNMMYIYIFYFLVKEIYVHFYIIAFKLETNASWTLVWLLNEHYHNSSLSQEEIMLKAM